jgi:hypothetical protein
MREFSYLLEPTGADSPSQNGAVEIYNDKLGIRTRALLYGAGLPAKYWSAALVHSVYLHNCLVHNSTLSTPFGLYYGVKPDLEFLRTFGSRVCVKRSGDRRAKLDRHDFTGIFLGYTATDQNIVYLDLDSGIVKHSHHATFDEAWYLQPARPPAAQLLYDLGLEADELDISLSDNLPNVTLMPTCPSTPPSVPWPPLYDQHTKLSKWDVPPRPQMLPLPLRETALPRPFATAAARVRASVGPDSTIASEFNVTKDDMAIVYMSQDPFFDSFEEVLDLRKWSFDKHRLAGLSLVSHNGRLYLGGMNPSTPGAKVDRWRVNLRGAWLIKVGSVLVSTISDGHSAFKDIYESDAPSVTLLFSHPELRRDISHKGLPIISSAPFSQQTQTRLIDSGISLRLLNISVTHLLTMSLVLGMSSTMLLV